MMGQLDKMNHFHPLVAGANLGADERRHDSQTDWRQRFTRFGVHRVFGSDAIDI
jgi:hypothetical protein